MKKMIAFSWFGGKYSCLNWLLPIIDETPHHLYCEPFGGSASVILNKKPSKIDVYNDLYSDVVTFFRVLRNQGQELIRELHLTPCSREEFANSCTFTDGDTDLEKARKFFIRARQVRLGLATTASPGRWSYDKNTSRRGMALTVSRWLNAVDGLEEVYNRLQTIQLENLDAIELIKRYDAENALFYLDPPYPMSTRSGGKSYKKEFDQHEELLNLIKSVKAKVIISSYENEFYEKELTAWDKKIIDVDASSARSSKNSSKRVEVVWKNF